jgi:phosphoribosylanthranilate isomerase
MMNLFIKICGITNAKDAGLAVSFGANALGFMMYRKSSRYIPKQEVKEILKELPDEIIPVMVFVDPSNKIFFFKYPYGFNKISIKR